MKKVSIGLIGCLIVLLICSPYQVAATEEIKVQIDGDFKKNLEVGQQLQLSYTITPEDASYKKLEWVSFNENLATVNQDGLVTAHKGGFEAEIRVIITKHDDSQVWTRCTIDIPVQAPESISLEPAKMTIPVGGNRHLLFTISPDGASTNIEWSSEDSSVATIKGILVTAHSPGTTRIKAQSKEYPEIVAYCEVTVTAAEAEIPVTGVSLNRSSIDLAVGDTEELTASVAPENATNKSVYWGSNDNQVATVNNGVVTAVGPGTTEVWVKTRDSEKVARCTVNVSQEEESDSVELIGISLEPADISLNPGDELKLTVIAQPANAEIPDLSWGSSDETVATVDQQGNLEAVGAGTTIVSVVTDYGAKSAECTVTVVSLGQFPRYILDSDNCEIIIPQELIENQEELEFGDNQLSASIPTQALVNLDPENRELILIVDRLDLDSPEQHQVIGKAYQFRLMAGDEEISELNIPLTMNFSYNPSEVTNPEMLAVHWYNPGTEEWIRLDSTVDDDNKVIVLVDHWGTFALLKQLPDSSKTSPWIYVLGAGVIITGGILSVLIKKSRTK